MKSRFIAMLLILVFLLTGCKGGNERPSGGQPPISDAPGGEIDLGNDDQSFGESIEDLGGNEGYFDEQIADVTINCVSGTAGAYRIDGNTITFTEIGEETVYSISGKLSGNIVIDVGDAYKFDLELHGFSLVSKDTTPITILSGNEVSISAKKDFVNYIYDTREAVDTTIEDVHSGAIHSEVDLEIEGKGHLTVISNNNNGIRSKKDLQVKNLTLLVFCKDNALKGDDSVEITYASLNLISTIGDGIKTTNSDISNKGNQRGTVSILDSKVEIYAACDGIDASYDVTIDGVSDLRIFTDKYSNYSEEVTANSKTDLYVRSTSKNYSYSVKYINSATGEHSWVNPQYHSEGFGGRNRYYYYSFSGMEGYDKMQVFVYSSTMTQGQENSYYCASEVMTVSSAYDTIAFSGMDFKWTNYGTTSMPGGPGGFGGGMNEGNSDKGDHSTKGIKAANQIVINSGEINVKSYDDALHATKDETLENGNAPLGAITVKGGSLTIYTNDDGIHADGKVTIDGGTVKVLNAYEGVEGEYFSLLSGYLSIISKDDGVNTTATTGTSIEIGGGELYIYCTGDGIDSNSSTSYAGILFSGGKTVIIANSNGNSAIDSEKGYKYISGKVVAIMPKGGMSEEATKCQNFSTVGKNITISLTKDAYIDCSFGDVGVTVKMPVSVSASVVILGGSSLSAQSATTTDKQLDDNGVCWY